MSDIKREAVCHLLQLARSAAGKITVERKRGAHYYHAEVDWLVCAADAMAGWLIENKAGLGISGRGELDAELDRLVGVYHTLLRKHEADADAAEAAESRPAQCHSQEKP